MILMTLLWGGKKKPLSRNNQETKTKTGAAGWSSAKGSRTPQSALQWFTAAFCSAT